MMPKARGKTAPPTPWITRPINMIGRVVARALTAVPAETAIRTMTIILSLPMMSPVRPRIGVAIAELRR